MDKDRIKDLKKEVSRILLEVWDPIGINDIPECQDEYSNYEDAVVSLVMHRASANEIADHLDKVAREWMEVRDAGDRATMAAELLVALES